MSWKAAQHVACWLLSGLILGVSPIMSEVLTALAKDGHVDLLDVFADGSLLAAASLVAAGGAMEAADIKAYANKQKFFRTVLIGIALIVVYVTAHVYGAVEQMIREGTVVSATVVYMSVAFLFSSAVINIASIVSVRR